MIAYLGGIDFLILDNLMSLTARDMRDEEAWKDIAPWNKSLTKRRTGVLWINHTGHDKSRDYGTSTRIWQMDTAMVAQKIDGHQADIAFKLEFVKARQRKPSNRADYETVDLVLQNDEWSATTSKATNAKKHGKNQHMLLDCLDTITASAGEPSPKFAGMPSGGMVVRHDLWRKQSLAQLGQASERRRKQAFDEAAEALIGEVIGKHGDYVWRMDQ